MTTWKPDGDEPAAMRFADALDELVDEFRSDDGISYAEAVGVLQTKAWKMIKEATDRDGEGIEKWN